MQVFGRQNNKLAIGYSAKCAQYLCSSYHCYVNFERSAAAAMCSTFRLHWCGYTYSVDFEVDTMSRLLLHIVKDYYYAAFEFFKTPLSQDSYDSSCFRLQLAAGAGSQCVPQECIQVTAWPDCPRTLPAMAQVRSAFPPAPRSMRSDASAPLWRLHVWRRGLLVDRTPDGTVGGETLTVYLIYSISGYTSSPRSEQTERPN